MPYIAQVLFRAGYAAHYTTTAPNVILPTDLSPPPADQYKTGDSVIVAFDRGIDMGTVTNVFFEPPVALPPLCCDHYMLDDKFYPPTTYPPSPSPSSPRPITVNGSILRIATAEDHTQLAANRVLEAQVKPQIEKVIQQDMMRTDVCIETIHYQLDRTSCLISYSGMGDIEHKATSVKLFPILGKGRVWFHRIIN
eukprot:PhF_6_TR40901/c0_g1_i4/m.61870